MYDQFYGFRKRPFSLNPDPSCLYLSNKHKTALSLMEYALINQAAFCVITGEIGTGKTTLVRQLLNQIDDEFTVGLLTNTHPSFGEVLKLILLGFGLEYEGRDKVDRYRMLQDFLIQEYSHDRKSVLIVDEAQNMAPSTLEELRMLSNINVDKHNVLQMILVGQEGLRDMLRRPELEQFAQRIAVDYCLQPLNRVESHAYILHRLELAGEPTCRKIFDQEVCDIIFQCTGGVPRLINMLCDLALVYGFADQKPILDSALIKRVILDKKQGGIFPLREDIEPLQDTDLDELGRLHSLREDEWVCPVPYGNNPQPQPTVTTDVQAVRPIDSDMDRPVMHSVTEKIDEEKIEVEKTEEEEIEEQALPKQNLYDKLPFTRGKPQLPTLSTLHAKLEPILIKFKPILHVLGSWLKLVLSMINTTLHRLKTTRNPTTAAQFEKFSTGSLALFRAHKKTILIAGFTLVAINILLLFSNSKSYINRTTANAVTQPSPMKSEPPVSAITPLNQNVNGDDTASKEVDLASLTNRSLATEQTPPDNEETSNDKVKPPAPKSENVIVVQEGNSLSVILAQAYGRFDEIHLEAVLNANPHIRDPDLILVGQEIKLPIEHPFN